MTTEVRTVGTVTDLDGIPTEVGVDWDSVRIGDRRFTLLELRKLLVLVLVLVAEASAEECAASQARFDEDMAAEAAGAE